MNYDKNELNAIKSLYSKKAKDENRIITLANGRSFIGWIIDGDDLKTLRQLEETFNDKEILDIYYERYE